MLLLLISFIAGVLTILAPCILPLLPVIVGRSLADATPNKKRLFVVVASLGVSVILFTLLLKASSLLIAIPQDFWKWISGGIIFLFGLTMVFPNLWEKFSFANTLSIKSNKVLTEGYQKNSVWGDVIIGASLGPIFSACSPTYFVILATVLPVSFFLGLVYLFTYVLGLSIALILVAILGERIMAKVGKISDPRGWFKKTFGIIFILVAIAIISGYDKKLQINLLDAGFLDVTKIEQKLLEKNDKQEVDSINEKSKKFILAPEISTPDGFINTNNLPITISEFRGKKIVLLDIWTYSCINCQRTIPYLNGWHKKYEDDGLVIIGLHTPEFAFEKIQKNVEEAVKEFGIKYPVVLDNDFSTWRAYKNQYWPRKYLIDIDGYIVYDHAGEGAYEETEMKIRELLAERAEFLGEAGEIDSALAVREITEVKTAARSPETYFGAGRNEYLGNGIPGVRGARNFSLPKNFAPNTLYLGGTWNIQAEEATANENAKVIYRYNAKEVYVVASSEQPAKIEVWQDGVFSETLSIKESKLYTLIKNSKAGEHTLELRVEPGISLFAFTFG